MGSFTQKTQSSKQSIVKAIGALCVGSAFFFVNPGEVFGQTNHSTTGNATVSVTDGMATGLSNSSVADGDSINFTGNHSLTINGDNPIPYGLDSITTATDGQGNVIVHLGPSSNFGFSSGVGTNANYVNSIDIQSSGMGVSASNVYTNKLNIAAGQNASITSTGHIGMLTGAGNLGGYGSLYVSQGAFDGDITASALYLGESASGATKTRIELNGVNSVGSVFFEGGAIGLGNDQALGSASVTIGENVELFKSGFDAVTIANDFNGQNHALTVHNDDIDHAFTFTGNITNLTSLKKTGVGTVGLGGSGNSFTSNNTGITIERGALQMLHQDAFGSSSGTAKVNIGAAGALMIGSEEDDAINVSMTDLSTAAGSHIILNIDPTGEVSTLNVSSMNNSKGPAFVSLGEGNRDVFVGASQAAFVPIVTQSSTSSSEAGLKQNPDAFIMEELVTSRYVYNPIYENNVTSFGGGYALDESWGYGDTPDAMAVAIPDANAFVMASIIAFDLPLARAQYANGPWAMFKGGEFSHDRSGFKDSTFQALLVGYDKTVGKWNAGVFAEFDWLYGRGVHQGGGDVGGLRSTHKGIGGAVYVSRDFANNGYIDVVGRVTRFDNEANLSDLNRRNGNGSYNANWKNNIFSLGIEVGKNLTSADGRWSFNPYNRLLYNSGATDEFGVDFAEGTDIIYRNHGFGTWTNRLGGRLSYREFGKSIFGSGLLGALFGNCASGSSCEPCGPCDPCDPCDPCGSGNGGGGKNSVKRIFFVGADYYQGLSGRFGSSFYDPALGGGFIANNAGHVRNTMAYGVTSYGITVFPRDNMTLSFIGANIFGDVEGYTLTLGSTLSF